MLWAVKFVAPSVDLREHRPERSATNVLTKQLCEQHVVVPVSVVTLSEPGVLVVAMVDPENQTAVVAELELFTGMKVEAVRASEEQIKATIRACYGTEN